MFANVLDTRMYYESVGEGLPVVFLHGLGATSNIWHGQRLALSKFFRVVTLDLPGSGRSDRSGTEYSMETWTEQVAGLADALELKQFVLVGHSMSTVLAQKFAAKHGERLKGLILCGPLTELSAEMKDAFAKRAELVRQEGMLAIADTVLPGWLTASSREGNAALAGMVREMILCNDPACYAGHCQALRQASAREDAKKISTPTLILVGDQDVTTPLKNCLAIAKEIKNAAIRIVPSTAHMTMMERPDLFNTLTMDFLANLALFE